jgi:omega-6 fatty acid desaturase (delta-12 desaturase)
MTPAPVRPADVDAWCRAAGVTLPQLRRAIPRECFTPVAWKSWTALARIATSLAAGLWLLSLVPLTSGLDLLWQIPLLAPLWVAQGWVLVGLFLIGHDCGHGSFSRRRWVNTLVGWIAMTPLANSFHAWRLTHERHHAFTQLRGHDVDWAGYLLTHEEFAAHRPSIITRAGYALPCGIFLWIAWNTVRRAAMLHTMFRSDRLARDRRALVESNLAMAMALAGLYGSLWYFAGLAGMLKYHGIPATVAMVTSWIIITIQHANEHSLWYGSAEWTPLRGQVVSTFDVRFPPWLEYVWCDGNIHIPHHVAPAVPWYHLRTAAAALRRAFPACYQEQAFTLRHVRWLWRTPFLAKTEGARYYTLTGPASAARSS